MNSTQDSDLAPFVDLKQGEKLSEIQPPLIIYIFNSYGIWKLHSMNLASNNSLFLCVLWIDIENNIAIAKLDDTEQPLRLSQQLHPDLNLLPVFRDVLDCYYTAQF